MSDTWTDRWTDTWGGAMSIPLGRMAWVWQESPAVSSAFDGYYVRAANGNSNSNSTGFNFLDNYHAWERATSDPLVAWTFVYDSTDPVKGATALARADAPAYCLDVEDYGGATVDGTRVKALVGEFRKLRPGRPIGFSTYATRAQAISHGVPWDTLKAVCDFSSPQVYFGYQAAVLDTVFAEHGSLPCLVSVSPNDYTGWAALSRTCGTRSGSVVFWRLGVLTASQRTTIAGMQFSQSEEDLSIVDAETKAYLDAKFAAVQQGLLVVIRGDATTDPPQPDTHPNNIERTRQDLAAGLSDISTRIDTLAGKVGQTVDPTAIATLVAGQLEITGIQTDPIGVVTVTFGARTS